jgi:hypothetical protein
MPLAMAQLMNGGAPSSTMDILAIGLGLGLILTVLDLVLSRKKAEAAQ